MRLASLRTPVLLALLALAAVLAVRLTLPHSSQPDRDAGTGAAASQRHREASAGAETIQSTTPCSPVPQECSPAVSWRQLLLSAREAPPLAPSTHEPYDPVQLNRAATPQALFEREPVDVGFAEQRERALKERISARLARRLHYHVNVDVECHTSSCALTFDEPDLNAANEIVEALGTPQLAEASQLGPRKSATGTILPGMSIVLLFSSAWRDRAYYETRLQQHEGGDDERSAENNTVEALERFTSTHQSQ